MLHASRRGCCTRHVAEESSMHAALDGPSIHVCETLNSPRSYTALKHIKTKPCRHGSGLGSINQARPNTRRRGSPATRTEGLCACTQAEVGHETRTRTAAL